MLSETGGDKAKGVPVLKFLSDFLFAIIVLGLLCAAPAHAYLDSATISLALQALTGLIAGWLVLGKVYWSKITRLFRRDGPAVSHDSKD